MISRFNSDFKASSPKSSYLNLRPQSATVTKVRELFNFRSSISSIARSPSSILKTSYKYGLKGALPIVSGLVFSSYLSVHPSVALCAPKDSGNDLENLPSEIQGYTRKELKEKKPNLFNYFYSENYKEHEVVSTTDIRTKAGAFQELLEMGEKVVDQVKGKKICIVLGNEGFEQSQFVSWLAETEIEKARKDQGNDGSRSLDFKQNPVHQIASPRVVEINNEMVVVTPGVQGSRGELISLAQALILERIINAANSASFVFTVEKDLLEPNPVNECEKSFFGLERIGNALSSVFSAGTADIDDIKSSRIKEWEKSFNEIVGSLGFIPEEIRKFKLSQGDKSTPDHQPKSPVMVFVNNPDASSKRFPLDSLNHIASTYDPEKSDRIQAIRAFSSLEKRKFHAKMPCAKNVIEMSINDLDRLKDHLRETLDNSPENCTLEQYKKLFDEKILPSINYCDRICSFAEGETIDKSFEEYKEVRKSFEEKLSLLISRWIDEVRESNNKLDAYQLSSFLEEISEKISSGPFLIDGIVSKLSPLVLPKTSPHVAGCVTTATASLIAFAPFPWVAIPVVIVAGVYMNASKTDQKILHIVGERTKNYFPIINKWVHEKPKLEYLSDAYDKILEKVSEKNTECLKKRNLERKKVKALLNDIKDLLSQPYVSSSSAYSTNRDDIDAYLRSEDLFYGKSTERFVEDIAKKTLPRSVVTFEDKYKEKNKDLHKWINRLACEDKDYFEEFDNDDLEEVFSKIKSLRVALDRLDSAQMDYIDYSVVKKQTEIAKSRVERINQSWVGSVTSWTKNITADAATAIGRWLPDRNRIAKDHKV